MRDMFRPDAEVMRAGPESAEFRVSRILDECLEEILHRGSTIPECLARYPDISDQLAPLLQAAIELSSLSKIQPSSHFKQATRKRLLHPDASTDPCHAPLVQVLRLAPLRFGVSHLTFAGIVLLAGLGIFVLSASSVPGNPLYVVKRGTEVIQLALAGDTASQADAHIFLAERRLKEAEILARNGNLDLAEQAASEYGRELSSALETYRSQPGLASRQRLLLDRLSQHEAELRSQEGTVPPDSKRALDHAIFYSQGIMEQIRLTTQ